MNNSFQRTPFPIKGLNALNVKQRKEESKERIWKEVSPSTVVCPWHILNVAPTGRSICSPQQSTCGICAGLTCQAHFLHRLKWTCKQRCVKDPWFFTTVFLKFSRQKYRSIGCEGNRVPVFCGVFTKELSCNVRDCVEWLIFWWRGKTGGENYLFAGRNKTIWCSQKWVTSTILLSSHITAYIIEIKTTMLQQQGTGV